ncbi:FkbM family methyltransferase [Leptospira fletcheri]|uniref:FkbM family methyltransferase n=1 Tax=Leptospira fletcheri TaxID=2484981 RepID=UPI0014382C1C|nr:FkbM family methyltransferase [Leptospira fletcheri]
MFYRDRKIAEEFGKISWSQEGEDVVLCELIGNRTSGFYVDIGAHHPFRFSNTQFFYNKGWRGINIEPTPGAIIEFERYRREDINLQIGIGVSKNPIDFFCMTDPALNTFNRERALALESSTTYKIDKTVSIPVFELKEILSKYCHGRKIDFLTMDVESKEEEVLLSNDWESYRPEYLMIEILNFDPENPGKSKIHEYLRAQGYSLVAYTGRTIFYKNGRGI